MANGIEEFDLAPNEFLLSIGNERQLPAALVGELLSAFSKDYRQRNRGRMLAISRVQSGSLLLVLTDALQSAGPYLKGSIEFAKGGKAVLDFVKSIKEAFGWKKHPDFDEDIPPRLSPYRTIEALAKVAVETGSEVRIRHVGTEGGSIDVEIKPPEAIAIRERTSQAEVLARIPRDSRKLPDAMKATPTVIQVEELADHLQSLTRSASNDAYLVIRALLRVLRDTGNDRIVELVAKELDRRGHVDLGSAVRTGGSED